MIEFALVAPLMILFSLGLVEMGRMTMVKQLITNISREGARLATLPDATNASVQAKVSELLSDSRLNNPSISDHTIVLVDRSFWHVCFGVNHSAS